MFEIIFYSLWIFAAGNLDGIKHKYTDQLCREVKEEIYSRSLTPVVRTVYQRTSFQLDDNNDVRITLDSNLIFINERPALRKQNEWRRQENTLEQCEDWVNFPYAILAVKLKVAEPAWLANITSLPGIRGVCIICV